MQLSISIPRSFLLKLDRLSTYAFREITNPRYKLRNALESAGDYMHREFRQRIIGEYGKNGRWPQLAEETVRDRQKGGKRFFAKTRRIRRVGTYGGRHPILQRKRSLIRAATGDFGANRYWQGTSYKGEPIRAIWQMDRIGGPVGGQRSRNAISQFALTVGVESTYIRELHDGGRRTPARPFIYATRENERYIRDLFSDAVEKLIREAGL